MESWNGILQIVQNVFFFCKTITNVFWGANGLVQSHYLTLNKSYGNKRERERTQWQSFPLKEGSSPIQF